MRYLSLVGLVGILGLTWAAGPYEPPPMDAPTGVPPINPSPHVPAPAKYGEPIKPGENFPRPDFGKPAESNYNNGYAAPVEKTVVVVKKSKNKHGSGSSSSDESNSKNEKCQSCGKIKLARISGENFKPRVKYLEKGGCKYAYLSCSMGKQAYVLAAEDVDAGQSYLHTLMPELFPDISTVKAISIGINANVVVKCKGKGKYEGQEIGKDKFRFKRAVCYKISKKSQWTNLADSGHPFIVPPLN